MKEYIKYYYHHLSMISNASKIYIPQTDNGMHKEKVQTSSPYANKNLNNRNNIAMKKITFTVCRTSQLSIAS